MSFASALIKFKIPASIPTKMANGIPTVKKCVIRCRNDRLGRCGRASGGGSVIGVSAFKCDKIFEIVIFSFSINNDRAAIFNAGRMRANRANLILVK